MSYLSKNKEVLLDRNIKLHPLFEENIELDSNITVRTINTLDGDECMIVRINNENYRLNSYYSPTVEIAYWMSQYHYDKDNMVTCMYGLGNGKFASAIAKEMGEKGYLIVVEPSKEVFLAALEHYDMTELFSNHRIMMIVLGINDDFFVNSLIYTVTWENIYDQIFCLHPVYGKMFPDKIKRFEEVIKQNNERVSVSRNTEAFFGKKYVYNMIDSLQYITRMNSLAECKEHMPSNVPAIIIAAGPSLDDNILELKKAKNRAILFATDRALPTLFKNNIIPDFIVTVDPNKADSCFENPVSKKIPLICPLHAKKEAIERQEGRIFLVACYEYIRNLFKLASSDVPVVDTGSSVATVSFSICTYLGIKKIIFVGQDLAYKGDASHTGGESEDICLDDERYVEGVNGELVRTRYDWEDFRLWFERKIHELDEDYEIIDATEGGALIHGTKVMTLQDTLQEYCRSEYDFEEIVKSIPLFWTEEKQDILVNYIEKGIEECNTMLIKIKNVTAICNKALSKIAVKELNHKQYQKDNNKIIDTNKMIEELSIFKLIDLSICRSAIVKHGEIDTNTKDELDIYRQSFTMYLDIYKEMQDMVKEMKVKFEKQFEILQGE